MHDPIDMVEWHLEDQHADAYAFIRDRRRDETCRFASARRIVFEVGEELVQGRLRAQAAARDATQPGRPPLSMDQIGREIRLLLDRIDEVPVSADEEDVVVTTDIEQELEPRMESSMRLRIPRQSFVEFGIERHIIAVSTLRPIKLLQCPFSVIVESFKFTREDADGFLQILIRGHDPQILINDVHITSECGVTGIANSNHLRFDRSAYFLGRQVISRNSDCRRRSD